MTSEAEQPTAADIIRALVRERSRPGLVMPNFTPANWFESDVFELTEAGYAREYEVKLSLADFRADANKTRRRYHPWPEQPTIENKHELLAAKSPQGPCQFWFCCPQPLAAQVQPLLPPWAGLYQVTDRGKDWGRWRWIARQLVEAPRLHNEPAGTSVKKQMLKSGYFRYLELLDNRPYSVGLAYPDCASEDI